MFTVSLGTQLVRESWAVKELVPPMFATSLDTQLVHKGRSIKGLAPLKVCGESRDPACTRGLGN